MAVMQLSLSRYSWAQRGLATGVSGGQAEHFVDELILTPDILSLDPPNLALAEHVERFITLKGSVCCLEFAKPLLGVHAAFNCSMVLFEDVVQILYRSVPTTPVKRPFPL